MDRNTYETLEYLFAKQAHESWSGWMRYLFSKGEFNDDGTWTMPAWAVERWQRQLAAPFDDLPHEEQESDVEEARKYLLLLKEVTGEDARPFWERPGYLAGPADEETP